MKTSRTVLIIISIFLFIIPFFWIKLGEINIGGDGSSIYFYDPINLIKHLVLYKIFPYGIGPIEVRYFYLPFVSVLVLLKSLFGSSYLISVLHTSLKLSVGFFSVYGIMRIILHELNKEVSKDKRELFDIKEIIAVLSGIFYIFSPLLIKEDRFINPIPSHDQVFLNPLVFYLVLKYFLTKKIRYLWSMLFITFIFSHSFSSSAAPAIFSFYPFAFLFIIFYILVILKKTLPKKGIIIGIIFFFLLHLFHLIPELINLFDPVSDVSMSVFSKNEHKQQMQYFYGVIGYASLAKSILLPSIKENIWLVFSFLSPFIIILGFLKSKAKSKTLLLTGFIFLILLFLISAKISYVSIKIYEIFFLYIPGFGMFRNFHIQWLFAYTFFYALIFGQALFFILTSFGKTKIKIFSLLVLVYLIGSAWTFIKGDQFNLAHVQTKDVKRLVAMDPQYEKLLEFIRSIPIDGKILEFPFTDFNFQVLHGINDGAYIGTPTIGPLTGIKDFTGYWHVAPYTQVFLQAAKEKNYQAIEDIFGLLNIRYIFHNSDPKIYDTTFFGRPFEYVRQYLPASQKDYREFIKPLVGEKLFEDESYSLYVTREASYIPHFYVPKKTITYAYNLKYDKFYHAASSFLFEQNTGTGSTEEKNIIKKETIEKRVTYIEENGCSSKLLMRTICSQDTSFDKVPKIYFKKINPIKYMVKVTNAQMPFLLVLSDAFHKDWKVFLSQDNDIEEMPIKTYFNGDIAEGKSENIFLNEKTFETFSLKNIPEEQHISVNAYANAWYITPRDIGMKKEATFIIEMTGQRVFYVTLLISLLSFIGFIIWGIVLVITKRF